MIFSIQSAMKNATLKTRIFLSFCLRKSLFALAATRLTGPGTMTATSAIVVKRRASGLNRIESITLKFEIEANARVRPHPGHGYPVRDLHRHGMPPPSAKPLFARARKPKGIKSTAKEAALHNLVF
jgi:hypothetical protein